MESMSPLESKLNEIEADMNSLATENQRLIAERVSAYVELDSWIALLARLAQAHGLPVGLSNPTTVVIELPSGQVSWEFAESEAHLYEALPPYKKPLEVLDNAERYARVMNPGF